MKAGNACNHPVQNPVSSNLLLKNIKITHTHKYKISCCLIWVHTLVCHT